MKLALLMRKLQTFSPVARKNNVGNPLEIGGAKRSVAPPKNQALSGQTSEKRRPCRTLIYGLADLSNNHSTCNTAMLYSSMIPGLVDSQLS